MKVIKLSDHSESMPVSVTECLEECMDRQEIETVLVLKICKNGEIAFSQGTDRKDGLLQYNEMLWLIENFKLFLLDV